MRLDDSYRLLDLDPAASDDEVKRVHRDLTKVWHPDRFGHDPPLRHRAEEKLKAIHQAYETIRESRSAGKRPVENGPEHERGDAPDASSGSRPTAEWNPESRAELERKRGWDYRMKALLAAAAAVFLALRRPTPVGLAIALALLGLSCFFVVRMRSGGRSSTPDPP
ncbi:MAG: J domain-containing protein [Holophagales bacterium]|jgi:hypothetical protein|nr:J domain-containing protein [Holophagales bacterium]MBK9967200.1 J domain-containing protein [Holophagales bacterium]